MQNRNKKHETEMQNISRSTVPNSKTEQKMKCKHSKVMQINVLNYHFSHMSIVATYKSHSDLIIPPQTKTIIAFIKPEKIES